MMVYSPEMAACEKASETRVEIKLVTHIKPIFQNQLRVITSHESTITGDWEYTTWVLQQKCYSIYRVRIPGFNAAHTCCFTFTMTA